MDVSILTATPIVLGVLTCTEEEQAVKRSTGDNNHGLDWGERLNYRGIEVRVLAERALHQDILTKKRESPF